MCFYFIHKIILKFVLLCFIRLLSHLHYLKTFLYAISSRTEYKKTLEGESVYIDIFHNIRNKKKVSDDKSLLTIFPYKIAKGSGFSDKIFGYQI